MNIDTSSILFLPTSQLQYLNSKYHPAMLSRGTLHLFSLGFTATFLSFTNQPTARRLHPWNLLWQCVLQALSIALKGRVPNACFVSPKLLYSKDSVRKNLTLVHRRWRLSRRPICFHLLCRQQRSDRALGNLSIWPRAC